VAANVNEKGNDKAWDPAVDDLGDKDPFDHDVLLKLYRMRRNSQKTKRQRIARDWFRSELFYNGVQWVVYDDKLKRWRESSLKRSTPKPVTNVYGAYSDIFTSLLTSVPIETSYRPLSGGNAISQTQMGTANDLVDALQEKLDIENKKRAVAAAVTRMGECYLIPRYVVAAVSDDEAGTIIPQPVKPSPVLDTGDAQQLLPKDGEAPAEAMPSIPRLVLDYAPPMQVYVDEEADNFSESPHFIWERSFNTAALKSAFPALKNKIHPGRNRSGDLSKFFAGAMKNLSSGPFGLTGYFASSGQDGTYRTDFGEMWMDPTLNYPRGVYMMVIGEDLIAHASELPYSDEEGNPYKNVIHMPCKARVGTLHGRTPLDDIIPKQVERNKLESFIHLIIYRMAAPNFVVPSGVNMEGFDGSPGQKIVVPETLVSGNTARVEILRGSEPGASLFKRLSDIDRECEYVLGITQALLGEIPSGLPAARALELALQRSKERHGDVFSAWSRGWAEVLNMALKIVREVRPMDLFKSITDDFGGITTKRFFDKDFDMDLELVPESQQPAPARSTASEMELLNEFIKGGVFQAEPNLQYQILNRYGMDWLTSKLKSDKEYISREHFLLMQGQAPIFSQFDNHPLHYPDHIEFRQTEKYLELAQKAPQLAQEFEMHIQQHEQAIQQAQAAQAAQQHPPEPPQTKTIQTDEQKVGENGGLSRSVSTRQEATQNGNG
jgi:hypothetical protein